MNWIGVGIGSFLGSARGGGILGGIVGAVVGNWLEDEVRSALRKRTARKTRVRPPPDVEVPDSPYEVLGCPPNASDEEVCRAYREKAKQYHPDTLRAQGLPDGIIASANDRMARVNAAWSVIRQERGL